MGKSKKRKRSEDEDDEEISRKIAKLQKKLSRRARRRRHDDPPVGPDIDSLLSPRNDEGEDGVEYDHLPANTEPTPTSASSATALIENLTTIEIPATTDNLPNAEVLELLGEDPSEQKTVGKDIHAELALRFQHIATKGISKELRKELQEKYLPPGNCGLIDAPLLNPEIKAAISDTVMKRDKGIETKQKQLGAAIAAIGEALSILLCQQEKNTDVIKILMDASRLLCDCQNTDSTLRRSFVLYNLKKDLKEQLQKTNIDGSLFGANLAETIKTAKTISKSGADLKETSKPAAIAMNKGKQQLTPAPRNLNWRAPPPSRRPLRGPPRNLQGPAPVRMANYSYRPSYRAPPPPPPPQSISRR